MAVSANKLELLQIADAVAREKAIERDEVLEAMEMAITKAGRSKYGHEHDIRAQIDRQSGDINLMRFRLIVETIDNEAVQVTMDEARNVTATFTVCQPDLVVALSTEGGELFFDEVFVAGGTPATNTERVEEIAEHDADFWAAFRETGGLFGILPETLAELEAVDRHQLAAPRQPSEVLAQRGK